MSKKILIIGGFRSGKNYEIFHFSRGLHSDAIEVYPDNYTSDHEAAFGGVLQNTPVVCGGFNSFKGKTYQTCHIIGNPKKAFKMLKRRAAAGVVN